MWVCEKLKNAIMQRTYVNAEIPNCENKNAENLNKLNIKYENLKIHKCDKPKI